MKHNSEQWLGSVVSEGINNRDELFKKLRKLRLCLVQENHKKARDRVKKTIAEKKTMYFEKKLTEDNGKYKELWKTLKILGLPNKVSPWCSGYH